MGLDPDDDLNADGVKALEVIRATDGTGTRCVLVDRRARRCQLALQSEAQQDLGVDWAYMKEKYEARSIIAKLTELRERLPRDGGTTRRRSRVSAGARNRGASRACC